MNDRLKEIIFDKLYDDLKHVEIIPHKNSIWFIDRERGYWYLEYEKSGVLYWRYDFFVNFFILFSLDFRERKVLMSEWVEEVLNHKVEEAPAFPGEQLAWVDKVLNCKIERALYVHQQPVQEVDKVLNCKIERALCNTIQLPATVDEVLNCKVEAHKSINLKQLRKVGEVLNCNVDISLWVATPLSDKVNEVLNADSQEDAVGDVLNHKNNQNE